MRYALPLLMLTACGCGPKDGSGFDWSAFWSAVAPVVQATAPAASEAIAVEIESKALAARDPGRCVAGMAGAALVRSLGPLALDASEVPAMTFDVIGPCGIAARPVAVPDVAWLAFDAAHAQVRVLALGAAKGCAGKVRAQVFTDHAERIRRAAQAAAENPSGPIRLEAYPVPGCDSDGGK